MNLTFRQGLISYQASGSVPLFLESGTINSFIDLNVSPAAFIATIAHGSSDYLVRYDTYVANAWGPLVPGFDNHLYIAIDLISGEARFGISTIAPAIGTEPTTTVPDMLWFNQDEAVMKKRNSSNTGWIDTPLVVVGTVLSGNPNQIVHRTEGSTVGLNTRSAPGFILFDSQLRPLRTSSGELLTADSPVRVKTTVGTAGVLTNPVNNFIPARANEAIPAMSLVHFSGADAISLASSNPATAGTKTPIGIIELGLSTNEIGVITQSGEITYDQWDWAPAEIGKPLYCGYDGELTLVRPASAHAFRVAYIKNPKTILFTIDSETTPQILSTAGSIISGTPPLVATTTTNLLNEIVTTISLPPATGSASGYMTAIQAAALGGFDSRISTNENDIFVLQNTKADVAHTHVIANVSGLQTAIDTLTNSLVAKADKVIGGTIGNFTALNNIGNLVDSTFSETSFARVAHIHTIADVTNLQTALNSKIDVGTQFPISTIIGLQADLNSRAFTNHTHTIANVTGLQAILDGKAAAFHFHTIAEVTGLQFALDGKASLAHIHAISDVTGLQVALNSKSNTGHGHTASDITGGTAGFVLTSSGTGAATWEAQYALAPMNEIVFGNADSTGLTSNSAFTYFNDLNAFYVNVPTINNESGEVIIRTGRNNDHVASFSELLMTSAFGTTASNFLVKAGNSSTNGGHIGFTAGRGTSGVGGSFTVAAGRGNTGGGGIALNSGICGGTGDGGHLFLSAGDTWSTAGGRGGDVSLAAGTGTVDGSGGNVSIDGGNSLATGGAGRWGGDINITAGQNQDTGASARGGDINITSGTANGTAIRSGHVTIQTGQSYNGPAGNINIAAGISATNRSGGHVSIIGGAGAGSQVAGNVFITAGLNSTAANSGSIRFTTNNIERFMITQNGAFSVATNAGTVGQVLTSAGPSAPAAWSTPAEGGAVAGANTQIQYNNSGAFAGSTGFTWTNGTNTLGFDSANTIIRQHADGGGLQIVGGVSTAAAGGSAVLQGGDAAGSGQQGGAAYVIGGAATLDSNGGSAVLQGGAGAGSGRVGGIVQIEGGVSPTGTGGWIQFSTAPTGTLVQRFAINTNGSWAIGTGLSAAFTGSVGQVISTGGSNAAPTWKEPLSKPMPMVVTPIAGTTFDFGSAAHHNVSFRTSSASAVTVTVRPDSFFTGLQEYYENNFNPTTPGPMPTGGTLLFGKHGSGDVTLVAGPGVTINTPSTLSITKLNGKATLTKVGPNEWDLEGNLATL